MALEGVLLGHYQLIRLLGSGGMGEVYLAEDTRIARQVAIKVVRNEADPYPNTQAAQDAARLFQREMKAIAALDHPHVLPLIDFGEQTLGRAVFTYMVMPFRSEGSLIDWLHQYKTGEILSLEEVLQLTIQAASALQHAHNRQLIHLDVKPSNFLIRKREDRPQMPDVLLADFGVAKFNTATSTASQSIRGTPTYMAPEQWTGTPVYATDQYALAVMVYQLLTGIPPYQGTMQQVMYQHLHEIPQPPSKFNSRIPPAVDNVILRALAKKSEDRFPSIQAFATTFEEAMHTRTPFASPTQFPETLPPTEYAVPMFPGSYGNSPLFPEKPQNSPISSFWRSSHKQAGIPRLVLIVGMILIVVIVGTVIVSSLHPSSGQSSTLSPAGNNATTTPTTLTNAYPRLSKQYSGTYANSSRTTVFPLELTSITEDDQGNITGIATLNNASPVSLDGYVTQKRDVEFEVVNNGDVFHFSGTIDQIGSIAGDWYMHTLQGTNILSRGVWNVS